jgi:hypothetical protein
MIVNRCRVVLVAAATTLFLCIILLGVTSASADNNTAMRIAESHVVSQSPAFSSSGTTALVPHTHIQIREGQRHQPVMIFKGTSLKEIAARFNELRIRPATWPGISGHLNVPAIYRVGSSPGKRENEPLPCQQLRSGQVCATFHFPHYNQL